MAVGGRGASLVPVVGRFEWGRGGWARRSVALGAWSRLREISRKGREAGRERERVGDAGSVDADDSESEPE